MAPIRNAKVIYKEIPQGYPEPGKTTVYDASGTIDLDTVQLPANAVLIKVLVLSIDPYIRGRMRDPKIPSYAVSWPAYPLNEPINTDGIGKIVKSTHPDLKPGDIVRSKLKHEEYTIKTAEELANPFAGVEVIKPHPKVPLSLYVGVAGMPGKTAHNAWRTFAKAKKGETAFVTSGGGPVGSMVIQLAKQDGLKVIASAGSDEKVAFMKECGADVVFNYKTTSTKEVLDREGAINVYWDNVGGETLDLALGAAANFARFIECGMISGYNSKEGVVFKNMVNIVAKRLTLNGFIQWEIEAPWKEDFEKTVIPRLADGTFKYKEDVSHGLEHSGQAILDVQKGVNKGKKIVLVAEE
ncbi:NAD(P)-binding protein [Schizophyllum commune Loenen D]|nr:NAD(P)-binding protein [Schizophyllum commune Loenen D]